MKFVKKFLGMVIIWVAFFMNLSQLVYAEAGLSEAGRTEYFKINENLGVSVLPGGEGGGGKDTITVFQYEDNPDYKGIKGRLCYGKYIISDDYDGAYFVQEDVYIKGDYVWGESFLVNIDNGKVWDFEKIVLDSKEIDIDIFDKKTKVLDLSELLEESELNSDFTVEEIRGKLLQERDLVSDDADKFDYEYIKGNYESLDIDNMQDFSCFIFGWLALLICVPVIIIIIVVVVIVKWYNNRSK